MRVRQMADNGLVLPILVVELNAVAISVRDSNCRNSSRTARARPVWASTCGCSSVTVERNPVAVSLQRRVDHVERGVGIAFARLIEFESRGRQRLQRAVMQVLGNFAFVTLDGLHCLRDQLTSHLRCAFSRANRRAST